MCTIIKEKSDKDVTKKIILKNSGNKNYRLFQ